MRALLRWSLLCYLLTLTERLQTMMSRQDVFSAVFIALSKQGKPAMSASNNSCVYRAEDGSKCAAGHLLTDKQLDEVYETTGIGRRHEGVASCDFRELNRRLGFQFTRDDLDSSKDEETDVSYASHMQAIHDRYASQGSDWARLWERDMRAYAEKNNLTVPVVGEVNA